MKKTIGVIGTGTIAAPMVRSLVRRFDDAFITVSPRSVQTGAVLSSESARVSVAADNQAVVDAADTLLLCMMADVAREVLPGLSFRSDQNIVSVMIDYPVEQLLYDCHPVSHIELTMPLPFIDTGNCPLPCYPSAQVVNELFGDDNPVTVLASEAQMLPYIAVAGVVSGFLQSVATVSDWLGAQGASPEAAEQHVLSLLGGYLHALPKDGSGQLEAAMGDLSTEGGLNAQFRQGLIDAGSMDNLRHQLDGLLARLRDTSGSAGAS